MKCLSNDTKLTVQVVLAFLLVIAGLVLLFMGFAVLIGAGETFTFAGALLGIEYAARTAVTKIKQDLMPHDDKK